MEKLLTVIIQTSPIPSHPSTALLEALFRSFQKADGLLESRIVIVCDGCEEIAEGGEKENNKHGKASRATAARYREHLTLLQEAVEGQQNPFVPRVNGSIQVRQLSERHGSARGIQAVFSIVQTPLVMICQHDNFFVHDVPLRACAHAMLDPSSSSSSSSTPGGLLGNLGVKCLHFMSTATMNYKAKVKKRYGVDVKEHTVELNSSEDVISSTGEPKKYEVVPLIFWYGRTHLSYRDHYTHTVLNRSLKTGDHLEELLGVTELDDIRCRGMEAHKDWGTFVLDQGCGEVIYHLSGRRARAATSIEHSEEQQDAEDPKHGVTNSSSPATPTVVVEEPATNNASFTTARSCRAIVPGLEIVSEEPKCQPQGKKFKQKCFHCGLKGHSYKWCPRMEAKPDTETIDLS